MPAYNSVYTIQKDHSKKLLIVLLLLVISLVVIQFSITNVTADDDDEGDDDDENDLANSLGWAAVGLLVVSSIYIFFYQSFRLTRKLSSEGKLSGFKNFVANVFRAIRKPLLYIHYFSGLAALGVLIAHGILLTRGDTAAAIGWASAGIYIFYIFTVLLLWFKIVAPGKTKKLWKAVLYVHRSLLLFAAIIAIHIIHVALIGDD